MIWPLLATAIAGDGSTFGDRDVSDLLEHRASGYLVRDVEDGLTVYRPFHEELRRELAEELVVDADSDEAGRAGVLMDLAQAQRRITSALRSLVHWDAA